MSTQHSTTDTYYGTSGVLVLGLLDFGALEGLALIQVDVGGHLPIPLGPPPFLFLVFQFPHRLLFLAVFRVLNFRSRFEALNDVFWENGEQHASSIYVSHPKFEFLR